MQPNNRLPDLVERCKKNDTQAQTALYQELASWLYGVCVRYTKSRDLAEDCLQEAFIKIFTNINAYKGDGPFEAWARRITVNEILSQFRKKNILTQSIELEQVDYSMPASTTSAYDNLSHEELLNFIYQLPESKRIIFNLYVVEGYTHKEIAKMLNITEGTSKSQLFKAKQLLAEVHQKHNQAYAY